MITPPPQLAGWESWQGNDPYEDTAGPFFMKLNAEPGKHRSAFLCTVGHMNGGGFLHGGMLMTFTDRAMGQTARLTVQATRSATISMTHQFLAPVKIGDVVEIAPHITKVTARLVFVTGTAFVGDDPVVSAQGVFRVSHSAP